MYRPGHHRNKGVWHSTIQLGSLVCLALWMTGCAYNYAGREGRTFTDERTAPPAPTQVVSVQVPEEERARLAAQREEESRRCAVATFDIHYFDPTTRITKTIDCNERTVVNVSRTPMGRTFYQEALEAKLPPETWYLLVDSRGERPALLNAQQLTQVSERFSVKLHGRDLSQDLLVYEYLDEEH